MLSSLLVSPLATGGSVLFAILGIGFLIFVHEFGHFLACRLTKTRVETFSIGFGTRLFGWENRPGEPKRFTLGRRRLDPADHAMDFRIALVPLGGYVKMAGENPGEERSGAPDEFPSKSLSARVFIVSAGVIMNVITAWVFYLIAYGAHISEEPAQLGSVEIGGPAWEAGLQAGDRIHSIAGTRTRSFMELRRETVLGPKDEPVTVVVDRNGERFEQAVTPRYDEDAGMVLLKILPPKRLTFEQGDRVLEVEPADDVQVNGVTARGGLDLFRLLGSAIGTSVGAPRLELKTSTGKTFPLEWKDAAKPESGREPQYKIGIEVQGHPVVEALRGDAGETLKKGDVIRAAFTASGRIEIATLSAWRRLPFQAGLEGLEVKRGDETLRVLVPGETPAALRAWLTNVHARVPEDPEGGLAVQPLPAGSLAVGADQQILRYPSSPAAEAGLRVGDVLLKLGDREVTKWAEVLKHIGSIQKPEPLDVTVRGRDGETRTLSMTPVAMVRLEGPEMALGDYWEPYETEGLVDAVGIAFARTGREIEGIFRVIGRFFTGDLDFQKNIGGPITIVSASSKFAERNWLHFLVFLAYISVTLAVLNILPIPILDGGHLMFMLIEKVKGSPLKEETMGKLQFAGLMLLLLLMVFAFKNDVGLLLE